MQNMQVFYKFVLSRSSNDLGELLNHIHFLRDSFTKIRLKLWRMEMTKKWQLIRIFSLSESETNPKIDALTLSFLINIQQKGCW